MRSLASWRARCRDGRPSDASSAGSPAPPWRQSPGTARPGPPTHVVAQMGRVAGRTASVAAAYAAIRIVRAAPGIAAPMPGGSVVVIRSVAPRASARMACARAIPRPPEHRASRDEAGDVPGGEGGPDRREARWCRPPGADPGPGDGSHPVALAHSRTASGAWGKAVPRRRS